MKQQSEKYQVGDKIRLIGRSSRLSLLQLEIVKQKIEATIKDVEVQIIVRNSRGDALPDVPLHTVEGSDFFTQDIFDALTSGEADIAVNISLAPTALLWLTGMIQEMF
jgi:porphobilinogen deaminase